MRAILPALLILCGWLQPEASDEPHTFYGKTVDGWIAVLRDNTSKGEKRREAACALGYFGPEARAAVPDLVDAVREERKFDAATHALTQIRGGKAPKVPVLIEEFLKRGCEHLTGQGTFMYSSAVDDALVRIGEPAVPALVEILNGPNWDMRVCAAHVLSMMGPVARAAVPSLLRAIEHPDPQHHAETLSLYAVRALGRIGPDARAAVPILNGLYGKKIVDDFDIVMALDGVGYPPVRRLVETLLHDADWGAAYELAWLGPKARAASTDLRAALRDRRPQCRFAAAVALASIDPASPESIPVLIEALTHLKDDEIDMLEVPGALARLGPRANAALPALIDLVRAGCDDTDVLRAMVQIDPDGRECVPALVRALKHKDHYVVAVAAQCLSLLGPRAAEAVPSLAEVVTHDFSENGDVGDSNPKVSAVKALRRIGAPAISALPALMAVLKRASVRAGRPKTRARLKSSLIAWQRLLPLTRWARFGPWRRMRCLF